MDAGSNTDILGQGVYLVTETWSFITKKKTVGLRGKAAPKTLDSKGAAFFQKVEYDGT